MLSNEVYNTYPIDEKYIKYIFKDLFCFPTNKLNQKNKNNMTFFKKDNQPFIAVSTLSHFLKLLFLFGGYVKGGL